MYHRHPKNIHHLKTTIMAKRKNLKKNINYVCAELLAECVAATQYHKADMEDVSNVVCGILNMQNDMICRVSHVQPGMKSKDFFKKMREDMAKRTEELIDQINGLA